MRLLLVRHGQTVWNTERRTQGRTDIPLDETGLLQAERLAERLSFERVDAVYTSPLSRAKAMAHMVAARHKLDAIASDTLIERDFGVWEGMTIHELRAQYGEALRVWQNDPYACVPENAETLHCVRTRCAAFLERIKTTHEPDETVVVISHSVPLRILIALLINLPECSLHSIEVENAAYTEVQLKKHRNVLCVLNDTAHLVQP
ncbi:histidine phosphatase family protein [Christensenellaceae bacterium OttesenSCG-928-L17]|nr:histidine phosphatase family protein [Christensenellaceae bacterium OttesenSCG-928-L17]